MKRLNASHDSGASSVSVNAGVVLDVEFRPECPLGRERAQDRCGVFAGLDHDAGEWPPVALGQQPTQCCLQLDADGAARAAIDQWHDIVGAERISHNRGAAVPRHPKAGDDQWNAVPARVTLPPSEQADVRRREMQRQKSISSTYSPPTCRSTV